MRRTLTHWVSPVQGNAPQTVQEVIDRMRAATPAGWLYRALIPTCYGSLWQADPLLANTCGMEIRPKDAADFAWVRDRFHEQSVLVGGWAVPMVLDYDEGYTQGTAAAVVDLFILDAEPYEGFLEPPFNRCPDEYIRGFQDACARRPWVSIVPQPSGIDPLGSAWGHWARFAAGFRPQCYGATAPQLAYPQPSMAFLQQQMKRVAVKRKVVPILDNLATSGSLTLGILAASRSDRDLWCLD